jgi:hypothetical protein
MIDKASDWWAPRPSWNEIGYDFGPPEARFEIRLPMLARIKLLWRRFRKKDRQPTRVIVEASNYLGDLPDGQEPPADSWFPVYDGPPGTGTFRSAVEARYWRTVAS